MPFYSGLSLFQVVQQYRGNQWTHPSSPSKSSSSEQEIFRCPDCNKMYKSKTSLNLHQRLECGKEPMFSCQFCPKKCHQKGNLKVHVLSKHKSELLNCSMESRCSVRSDEHEWVGSNGTS